MVSSAVTRDIIRRAEELTPDVRVHTLDQIHELLETSARDAQPTSTPVATIALSARPVWVRYV